MPGRTRAGARRGNQNQFVSSDSPFHGFTETAPLDQSTASPRVHVIAVVVPVAAFVETAIVTTDWLFIRWVCEASTVIVVPYSFTTSTTRSPLALGTANE